MADEKPLGGGGPGGSAPPKDSGKGPAAGAKTPFKKKSVIIFSLVAFTVVAWYLYQSKFTVSQSPKPKTDDKVLNLYEEGTAEKKKIVSLYRENLRFAQFDVERLLIELEKIQRTAPLDMRLAGLKAEYYEEQKKDDAIKEEDKKIQAEKARLKKLLDDAVNDVKRYTQLVGDAEKKEHQPKPKAGEASK